MAEPLDTITETDIVEKTDRAHEVFIKKLRQHDESDRSFAYWLSSAALNLCSIYNDVDLKGKLKHVEELVKALKDGFEKTQKLCGDLSEEDNDDLVFHQALFTQTVTEKQHKGKTAEATRARELKDHEKKIVPGAIISKKKTVMTRNVAPVLPTITSGRPTEHFQRITAQYQILVGRLSCFQEVVGMMYEEDKLKPKEMQEILKWVASHELYEASERLLDIVASGTVEVYKCFLDALKQTRQTHVYDMLVNKNKHLLTEEERDSPRNQIRLKYTGLMGKLDISIELLSHLYKKKVLSKSEFESFTTDMSNPMTTIYFLSIIGRKSNEDFETFKRILQEIGQGHVSKEFSESAPFQTQTQEKRNLSLRQVAITDPDTESNSRRKVDQSCFYASRTRKLWNTIKKRSRMENAEDNSHLSELSIKVLSSKRKTKIIRDDIIQDCVEQPWQDTNLAKKECLQAKEDYNRIHMELDQSREALKRTRRLAKNRPNDEANLNASCEPRRGDAKLIHVISTTAVKKNDKAIWGITVLENKIYVVSRWTPEVEVFERVEFSFIDRVTMNGLTNPEDIRASVKSNQLFIADATYPKKSKSILRIEPSEMKVAGKWQIGDYEAILSVTEESNVIATIYANHTLIEYTQRGEEVYRIDLSKTGMMHPWHAVKISNGNLVVCHGHYDEPVHRVCEIDRKGLILKSFGGPTNVHDLDVPVNLAIDTLGSIIVADYRNCRVLLLSSELKYQKEILSKQFVITRPSRLHLDEENGTLIIADNEAGWKNGRVLVFKIDLTY